LYQLLILWAVGVLGVKVAILCGQLGSQQALNRGDGLLKPDYGTQPGTLYTLD
jgi:hypothetical protein